MHAEGPAHVRCRAPGSRGVRPPKGDHRVDATHMYRDRMGQDVESWIPDLPTAVGILFVRLGAPVLAVTVVLTVIVLVGYARAAILTARLGARVIGDGASVAAYVHSRFVGGTSALFRLALLQGFAVFAIYLASRLLYGVGGLIYRVHPDWWAWLTDVLGPPSDTSQWTTWPPFILLGIYVALDGALAIRSTIGAALAGWASIVVAAACLVPAFLVAAGFAIVFVVSLLLFLLGLLAGSDDLSWPVGNLTFSPLSVIFTLAAFGTAVLIRRTTLRSAEVLFPDLPARTRLWIPVDEKQG